MKTRSPIVTIAIIAVSTAFLFIPFAFAFQQEKPDEVKAPLYVFFFIGDGMASAQIHAAEAYLGVADADNTTSKGFINLPKLTMSDFPVFGMQTSVANNRFITGSAAAGTALACGEKTNIGVIAMNPDATKPYTSLAEAAKVIGMKVGIVSSVSIDHATPAVFYAHTQSRNDYEAIGHFLLNSDFDYFAGGGFTIGKYKSKTYTKLSTDERVALVKSKARANGFTVTDTRDEFDDLGENEGRVLAINPHLDRYNALPTVLNRMTAKDEGESYEGSITLAEFTRKGIDLLKKNEKGFFMMVEGGKIDWACHANDARTAIEEIIAFDKAVSAAVEFAKTDTGRTLIVVTGDHECGGLSLGTAKTGYDSYLEKLEAQTIAYDDFQNKTLAAYKTTHNPAPSDIDLDMWQTIFEAYGMDGNHFTQETRDDLTEYEIGLLEDAFDKTMTGRNKNTEEKNGMLYGRNDPLTVTLTHLLNEKSGLSWASYSHTAVPVPVFAMGYGSELFDGYYDNTDVAKKIAKIIGVNIGD